MLTKEEIALKEKMIDLRMKLVNAEIQSEKIIGLLPLKYGLPCRVRYNISKADNELVDIAKLLGLGKIGIVKLDKEE